MSLFPRDISCDPNRAGLGYGGSDWQLNRPMGNSFGVGHSCNAFHLGFLIDLRAWFATELPISSDFCQSDLICLVARCAEGLSRILAVRVGRGGGSLHVAVIVNERFRGRRSILPLRSIARKWRAVWLGRKSPAGSDMTLARHCYGKAIRGPGRRQDLLPDHVRVQYFRSGPPPRSSFASF